MTLTTYIKKLHEHVSSFELKISEEYADIGDLDEGEWWDQFNSYMDSVE